jgi:predicted O-methyltransferase YrrM
MSNGMDNIEKVRTTFEDLEYMRHPDAMFMRDFIISHDVRDILEIGFYHGKSSAYFAAILEDLERGHLVTIDHVSAGKREPNIEHVLSTLDLTHRVTPIYSERSYTWEMGKMIRATPRPQFDLCYFDGDHTWDGTGFGFLLVDMLLRPGGWIIFDDLKWTVAASMQNREKIPRAWRACSEDEKATAGVRMVFDLLAPHLGYTQMRTAKNGWWGIARKPLSEATGSAQPRSGLLKGIRNAFGGR